MPPGLESNLSFMSQIRPFKSSLSLTPEEKSWYYENYLNSNLKVLSFMAFFILLGFAPFDFVKGVEFSVFLLFFLPRVGCILLSAFVFYRSMKDKARNLELYLMTGGLISLTLFWTVANEANQNSYFYHDVQFTLFLVFLAVGLLNGLKTLNLSLILVAMALLFEYLTKSGLHFKYANVIIVLAMVIFYRLTVIRILRSEAEVQASKEKIQWLFDVMEHDLANKLLAVNLNVAQLAMSKELSDKDRGLLSNLSDGVASVVHDMRTIAARKHGPGTIESALKLELISGHMLESELKERIKFIASAKNHRLAVRSTGDPAREYLIDEELFFEHVLGNIIGNKAKYSPEESTIEVIFDFSDQLSASVSDEGPGVKLSSKTGLPVSGQSKNSGSGRGTQIAQRGVAALGGRLIYENLEKGTRVTVVIGS